MADFAIQIPPLFSENWCWDEQANDELQVNKFQLLLAILFGKRKSPQDYQIRKTVYC